MTGNQYCLRMMTKSDWSGEYFFPDNFVLLAPTGDCISTIAKQPDGTWLWVLDRDALGRFVYREGKAGGLDEAKAAMAESISDLKDARTDKIGRGARPASEMPDTSFNRYR